MLVQGRESSRLKKQNKVQGQQLLHSNNPGGAMGEGQLFLPRPFPKPLTLRQAPGFKAPVAKFRGFGKRLERPH